jgi:hypothetical protein
VNVRSSGVEAGDCLISVLGELESEGVIAGRGCVSLYCGINTIRLVRRTDRFQRNSSGDV